MLNIFLLALFISLSLPPYLLTNPFDVGLTSIPVRLIKFMKLKPLRSFSPFFFLFIYFYIYLSLLSISPSLSLFIFLSISLSLYYSHFYKSWFAFHTRSSLLHYLPHTYLCILYTMEEYIQFNLIFFRFKNIDHI